jgi:hypothetical protein
VSAQSDTSNKTQRKMSRQMDDDFGRPERDNFGTMRKQRPIPQDQRPLGSMPKELGGGPRSIEIDKPDTRSILKKLKAIDRDTSRKYRQQGGE